MKDNIKKAFESAEQEIQEKEIAQLKSIIKDLLQKKADAEEDKREIEKEISVIKQTIDDFKAGRLDKVKELIEKDTVAKKLLPFNIIIINQPVYTQPWKWVYQIQPVYSGHTGITTSNGLTMTTAGANNAMYLTANTTNYSGSTCSNFVSGTYGLNNGKIINL